MYQFDHILICNIWLVLIGTILCFKNWSELAGFFNLYRSTEGTVPCTAFVAKEVSIATSAGSGSFERGFLQQWKYLMGSRSSEASNFVSFGWNWTIPSGFLTGTDQCIPI